MNFNGFFKDLQSGFSTAKPVLSYINKHKALWVLVSIRMVPVILIIVLGLTKYRTRVAFWLIPILLLMDYICTITDVAAAYYIRAQLDAQPITVIDSLKRSLTSAFVVLKFTLTDLVMRFFTGTKNNSSKISFITMIISLLAGLTWSVATYFIPPVMAEEKISMTAAIKKSAHVMRTTFGHVVGFQLGIQMICATVILVALFPMVSVYVAAVLAQSANTTVRMLFGASLLFSLACVMVMIMIYTLMTWVLQCVAYNFALAKNIAPFDRHLISHAIITDNSTHK